MLEDNHDGFARRGPTLALAGLAAALVELAIADPASPRSWALGWAAAGTAAAMAASQKLASSDPGRGGDGIAPAAAVGAAAGFALPFTVAAIRSANPMGQVSMPEVLLLVATRNLMLVLAAFSYRPACARLAALASLLLSAVGTAIAEGPEARGIVALYAATGCLWLITADRCRSRFRIAAGQAGRSPWASLALPLGVIATATAVAAVGPNRAATALAELVPTSGGTGRDDPRARAGVGDGDNEVRGTHKPESLGFAESDVYLDTDRPSLYDTFNDSFGEPFKPKAKLEPMIAVKSDRVTEQRERPTENLKAGHEFALVRRMPGGPPRRPPERGARALLFAKGPTPLHLAFAAYDRFDGQTWRDEAPVPGRCTLNPDGDWLRLTLPESAFFAGPARHQFKVGRLNSSTIPAPALLARFRMGRVNRADLFSWAHQGIVRFADRSIPAGTVVDTEARTVDPGRLLDLKFDRAVHTASSGFRELPTRLDPGVSALAACWTKGVAPGWAQVEAIVAGVRGHCILDRAATVPPGCEDVVGRFLLHARRGPDYQFASASAVMLRRLGYPSRLVGGFYAGPGGYDPTTGHIPISEGDAHVWAQVQLPNGVWVDVEPTPGFEVMGPIFSWPERLERAGSAAGRWLAARRWVAFTVALALALAVRVRRRIYDVASTLAWSITARGQARALVLRTLRLVERRSRWAGRPRPGSRTLARWYGPMAAASGDRREDLERLIRLADWALHAQGRPASDARGAQSDIRIRTACRRAVRAWTLGQFRAVVPLVAQGSLRHGS